MNPPVAPPNLDHLTNGADIVSELSATTKEVTAKWDLHLDFMRWSANIRHRQNCLFLCVAINRRGNGDYHDARVCVNSAVI